jgi:hypothetical protein
VVIKADEAGIRVGTGHDDRGGTAAAADVGDARSTSELGLDAVEGGDPVVGQVPDVVGAEEPPRALNQVGVMLAPRHTLAPPEGLGEKPQVGEGGGGDLEPTRSEQRIVLTGECERLLGREAEPSGRRIVVGVAGGGLAASHSRT